MKLSIFERFGIIKILPRQDNILTMKVISDLKKKIGVTSSEMMKVKDRNNANINELKTIEDRDFDLSEGEMTIIKETLKDLNDKKKLEESHISLWDKFIDGGK